MVGDICVLLMHRSNMAVDKMSREDAQVWVREGVNEEARVATWLLSEGVNLGWKRGREQSGMEGVGVEKSTW
jgi:hypothetical protein